MKFGNYFTFDPNDVALINDVLVMPSMLLTDQVGDLNSAVARRALVMQEHGKDHPAVAGYDEEIKLACCEAVGLALMIAERLGEPGYQVYDRAWERLRDKERETRQRLEAVKGLNT